MDTMESKLYEGYYRDFIEKTPFMILVTDENGLLFHVNEAWKRVLNYPVDVEMNQSLWHFVHPYSRTLCQDNFRQASPGDCFDLEIVFIASDRSLVFAEGKFNCSYDAINQLKIITGIVQDVTDQNQQTLEIERIKYHLEEKINYWNMLQKAYASLINEEMKHFDDNIVEVLKRFGRLVYADRAFIIEYNFKNQFSTITYEWCNQKIASKKNQLTQIPFSKMEDWIEAHVSGEFFYIQDVLSLPNKNPLRNLLESYAIMSMIAVPMIKEGKCFGCVGFDSVKVHRTDAEVEKQILSDLGTLFLYAIKRRKKYMDLHEKDTRYRSYLKNAPVAIVICDKVGKIQEVNLELCLLSGFTQKELIGKKIKKLFSMDLTEHLDGCFLQELNKPCTAVLLTKSGESYDTKVSISKANATELVLSIVKMESD